ncbi:hypothetical protein V2G26_019575 [Clonostachys chloroleuca]
MIWSKIFLLVSCLVATSQAYDFKPDHHETYINDHIPIAYNVTGHQLDQSTKSSYFTISFITTTNNEQYFLLHHILKQTFGVAQVKSSILQLETLQRWDDVHIVVINTTNTTTNNNQLDFRYGEYGISAKSPDGVSSLQVDGATPDYSFNITFNSTSRLLLNGGTGAFAFGPNYSNTSEWGIPAGRTEGTLTISGDTLDIDAEKSLTWYDRQLIYNGAPDSWVWFGIHLPDAGIKGSIWSFINPETNIRYDFGTFRYGKESQLVLAGYVQPSASHKWTSPVSNATYTQSWVIDFEDVGSLTVESITDDQEIYDPKQIGSPVFEGFVTVSGTFFGRQVKGYGAVEQI